MALETGVRSKMNVWDLIYATVLPYCLDKWQENYEAAAREAVKITDAAIVERRKRFPAPSPQEPTGPTQ